MLTEEEEEIVIIEHKLESGFCALYVDRAIQHNSITAFSITVFSKVTMMCLILTLYNLHYSGTEIIINIIYFCCMDRF
jgi:hypothetical protein